jgi:uncharacterized membrane protein YedE/YeeE
MSVLVNLLLGLLFGIGLVVSGMADPAKVLNFLDLAGTWDPSLLFVMGGAAITTFVGYRFVLKRSRPLLAEDFQLPSRRDIDGRLLFGAGLFGIGWGLGGFCPGPVLTTIGLGATGTLWFVPAMFVGMLIARQAASR